MSAEPEKRAGNGAVSAERVYALLYQLTRDVARLEALLRAMKKRLEDSE